MGVSTGFACGKVCCHSNNVQQTVPITLKKKKLRRKKLVPKCISRAFVNTVYGSRVMTRVSVLKQRECLSEAAACHRVPPPLESAGGTDIGYAEHIGVIIKET